MKRNPDGENDVWASLKSQSILQSYYSVYFLTLSLRMGITKTSVLSLYAGSFKGGPPKRALGGLAPWQHPEGCVLLAQRVGSTYTKRPSLMWSCPPALPFQKTSSNKETPARVLYLSEGGVRRKGVAGHKCGTAPLEPLWCKASTASPMLCCPKTSRGRTFQREARPRRSTARTPQLGRRSSSLKWGKAMALEHPPSRAHASSTGSPSA